MATPPSISAPGVEGYKSGEEEEKEDVKERMATEEEEDDAFASGLVVGIWHDDEEIDMNIALWTS